MPGEDNSRTLSQCHLCYILLSALLAVMCSRTLRYIPSCYRGVSTASLFNTVVVVEASAWWGYRNAESCSKLSAIDP